MTIRQTGFTSIKKRARFHHAVDRSTVCIQQPRGYWFLHSHRKGWMVNSVMSLPPLLPYFNLPLAGLAAILLSQLIIGIKTSQAGILIESETTTMTNIYLYIYILIQYVQWDGCSRPFVNDFLTLSFLLVIRPTTSPCIGNCLVCIM